MLPPRNLWLLPPSLKIMLIGLHLTVNSPVCSLLSASCCNCYLLGPSVDYGCRDGLPELLRKGSSLLGGYPLGWLSSSGLTRLLPCILNYVWPHLHCKKRRVVLTQFGYLSFIPLLHHWIQWRRTACFTFQTVIRFSRTSVNVMGECLLPWITILSQNHPPPLPMNN